ncbi:apolipoprotein N-acyltransferase [Candidatus Erwinia haradaeae]|uniref:Apolipoprotein N-acyltransferase n=1 Tax=Candidatus Erwinia haradaeae TaxID=1922217 RepID=A0A451D2H3_9GAMM|nr:apolipoprotein N-acyltransferase [Candidatus Erwinia haradaeae]VFP79824.1 Apolipoprotein N-acyltransferase [Candidatus Erwinia haradaeae]
MILINIYSHKLCYLSLALIIGAIGTLSFSPYNFWPAALLSFSGFQFLMLQRTTRNVSVIGFMWGLGFFGTGMHWLYFSLKMFSGLSSIVNILIIFVLTAYLALYPLLFSTLLNILSTQNLFLRLIILSPVLWQITEFLRSIVMTGLPWLQFGYTQINGPLKGIAPLMGEEAITFFLVILSGLLVYAVRYRQILSIVSVIIIIVLCWSLSFITWFVAVPERTVDVTLVQGNMPPLLKWDLNDLTNTLNTYIRLSAPYVGKTSIIIWPESAIPDLEANQQLFLKYQDKQFRNSGTALITGIIDSRIKNNFYHTYNAIIVIGNVKPYHYLSKNRYQKSHLVPFGEYIPCISCLRYLISFFHFPESTFSCGKYLQPQLDVLGYYLTPALCYEVAFKQRMRDNFRQETDFLLTMSNDAWFGDSIGPWQHLQMAQMRALELGRPLLNSTNNGITTIINANGEITNIIPQFQSNALRAKVTPTTGLTPYARFGNCSIWAVTLLFSMIWLICVLRLFYKAYLKKEVFHNRIE